MGDWFGATAQSGTLLLAVPVALVAGLVSFFSPCVLPLVPAYFSYATGLSGVELAGAADHGQTARQRSRMLAGSVLFVLGFSVVFVAIGTVAGTLGAWLWEYRRGLGVLLGVLAILLGLVFLGATPLLQRERRVHAVPAVGVAAAPLLGFLFGLGWTPCIGPTLGVISTLAANEGTAARGALLSGVYALGLGIPFVLGGLAYHRLLGTAGWVRRHIVWVNRAGGVMMIVVGLLLLTGWWDWATSWLQTQFIEAGLWETAI